MEKTTGPFYLIDGSSCQEKPEGCNGKGYPYIIRPVKPGARPIRQRLYTADHLRRRGIEPKPLGR